MIFTIGHSNHSLEVFLGLLQRNGVETIVDTRSSPRSKYVPQFDAAALQRTLEAAGIRYVYMGRELGGRPDGTQFYDDDGRVLYGEVAEASFFRKGLERLETDIPRTRMALLCAEENPSVCHRRLLIARVLAGRGVPVCHIRGDGRVETEDQMAAEETAAQQDAQLSLFEHAKVPEWKSIPSVLPKKTAERFFGLIQSHGIRRLLDVRLNNVSQLAGFAKREDLSYFLREICGADYIHEPMLAPTQEMLDSYKKAKGSWEEYAARFLHLMAERRIEDRLDRALFDVPTVLLCSEPAADQCHRRLVLNYLSEKWGGVKVTHL